MTLEVDQESIASTMADKARVDGADLLQSYFEARLVEPRDYRALYSLLERIAWAGPTEDAWNNLLEAVSANSDSTEDQGLTCQATRLALALMRVDQHIVDLSLGRFAEELEPRAIHVLSQNLKMARVEGPCDESISLEFYSAFCNSNSKDGLARQELVNTVHATGEPEWAVRLLSDSLLKPLDTYHPNPSKWRVTAAIGVKKLFANEQAHRDDGAADVDSRPLLRDDNVAAACNPGVFASEWVALSKSRDIVFPTVRLRFSHKASLSIRESCAFATPFARLPKP